MNATLRKHLDDIQDMLNGPEGKPLADILSALRGPDLDTEEAYGVKTETTTHIRRAAFPLLRTDTYFGRPQALHGTWDMTLTTPNFETRKMGHHFMAHTRAAAYALGIFVPYNLNDIHGPGQSISADAALRSRADDSRLGPRKPEGEQR